MLRDFREFVARGNVFDLAVGVVIGAAFAKVVDSFVKDVLMPPIGMASGGVDFNNLFVSLNGQHYPTLAAAQEAAAPTLNYGLFLNTIFQFLLVAFVLFLFVRQYNRLRRTEPDPLPAVPSEKLCPYCQLSVPTAAVRCGHCTSQL
jgi:large conductance mechanosensitive channel